MPLTQDQINILNQLAKQLEGQEPPLTTQDIQAQLDAKKNELLSQNEANSKTDNIAEQANETEINGIQTLNTDIYSRSLKGQGGGAATTTTTFPADVSKEFKSQQQIEHEKNVFDKRSQLGLNDYHDNNGDLKKISFKDFKNVGGRFGLTAESDMVERLQKAYGDEFEVEGCGGATDCIKLINKGTKAEMEVFLPSGYNTAVGWDWAKMKKRKVTNNTWGDTYTLVERFISGRTEDLQYQYEPGEEEKKEKIEKEAKKEESKKLEPVKVYNIPVRNNDGQIEIAQVANKPKEYQKQQEFKNRSKNPIHDWINRPTYEIAASFPYGNAPEDRVFNITGERAALEFDAAYGSLDFEFTQGSTLSKKGSDYITATYVGDGPMNGEKVEFSVNTLMNRSMGNINYPSAGESRAILTNFIDQATAHMSPEEVNKKREAGVKYRKSLVNQMANHTSLTDEEVNNIEMEFYETDNEGNKILKKSVFDPVEEYINARGGGVLSGMDKDFLYDSNVRELKSTKQPYEEKLKQANQVLTDKKGAGNFTRDDVLEYAAMMIVEERKNEILAEKDDAYMNSVSEEEAAFLRLGGVELRDEKEKELLFSDIKQKRIINDIKNSDEHATWNHFQETLYTLDGEFEAIPGEEMVTVSFGNTGQKEVPKRIYDKAMLAKTTLDVKMENLRIEGENTIALLDDVDDIDLEWDAIRRNYDDWEKFYMNFGLNFASMIMNYSYGANKMMGGEWNPVVAREIDQMKLDFDNGVNAYKNRYRKDISFKDMEHGKNAGRWYAQFASQQLPILMGMVAPGGLWTMYGMSAGQKWTDDLRKDIAEGGDRRAGWKKHLGMHGYALAEVLPEKYITLPMIRRGKGLLTKTTQRKQLFDNSFKSFYSKEFAEYSGRQLIVNPVMEAGSEGFTSFAQNMIDGNNPLLNMEEAVFGGGVMGIMFGGTPYIGSVYNAAISDHTQNSEIRKHITSIDGLALRNNSLNMRLRLLEKTNLFDPNVKEQKIEETKKEIQENIELIDGLQNTIEGIQMDIEKRVSWMSTSELKQYIELTNAQEALKVNAKKIIDNKSLSETQKQEQLKPIKEQFDLLQTSRDFFRDKDAFTNPWNQFKADNSRESKERRQEIKEKAISKLNERGVKDPSSEQIENESRTIYNMEYVNEDIKTKRGKTKLGKSLKVAQTRREAKDIVNKNQDDIIKREQDFIQQEQKKENPNQADIIDAQNQIELAEMMRKEIIAEIDRNMHGINMPNPEGGEGIPVVVVENQAQGDRLETRTHELGHTIFNESLGIAPEAYNYLSDHILSWAETNANSVWKRIMIRAERDRNGDLKPEEVIAVFLESVADDKVNFPKDQKGFFPKIFGFLAGKAVSEQAGTNFDFDFRGEQDVINFMIGLGKKIKQGKLNVKDRAAIKRSLRGLKERFAIEPGGKDTYNFSKEKSLKVQEIYNERGVDGAFDIIDLFKPITSKITEKRREAPNYDKELLMSEIEVGERGIYDLIQSYDPTSGVPLAAYINTYLPSRAIEASRRVLGEEFTEDVSERVDIAAEEVSVEPTQKTPKKIKLHERLGKDAVNINKEVKKQIPNLEGKTFKNLTDLTPSLTQEMFGIIPKPGNLTKGDIKNAQMFIAKNADVLIKMLPEGATSSGTSTGVQKVLLDAFYTKTDRVKMAKTGSKAGLAVYRKRNNITNKEFLEVFGITEKGNPNLYKKDSNTSSRIKALVAQTGKTLTNQAVREEINKIEDTSNKVRLALEDGKSIYMFSKDGINESYPEFVNEIVASNAKDQKSILNAINRVYTKEDITENEKKKLVKKVYAQISDFDKILKKHSFLPNASVRLPMTIQEVLLNDYIAENTDYAIKAALEKKLPKDKNGKTIDIGTHYLDINRINNQRAAIVDLATEMSETMPVQEVLETILKYYKGMFVGASKIADGRFVVENGEVVDNPKWDSMKNKKPKNRKQVFQNMQDFIDNFVMKLPGVTNVSTKISTDGKVSIDKVTINGEATSIDSKLLGENSNAALTDMNFEGREAQALKAREEVERLLDFYWKRISSKDPSLDAADLGMILTSMGSGMTSIMRRAANFKYIGEGVDNVPKNERGEKLEYEHMIPQVEMTLNVLQSYMDTGKLDKSIWEDYHVAIIPKTMDKVLIENGFRSKSPVSGNRYYNMQTFGDKRLVPIMSIDPKDNGKIIGEDFVKAGQIINGTAKDMSDLGALRRAYQFSRETSQPIRGASIWDFDDTLGRTKSGVRYTLPNPDGSPQPGRKVIFLAGGAGSGKSNVVRQLGLEDQGFKIVNSDISLEWLKKNSGLPEDMNDLTREQLSELGRLQAESRRIAKRKMMKFQGQGDGIIVDGTGGSINVMKKQVQEFKDKGYDVQMLFVETSVETALERNRNRKERSLLDKIVIKNHEKVQGNKEAFRELFGNNFAEVKTDKLGINDPMPAKLVEQMNSFTSGYIKGRLDAEQFANEGADLLAQGAEFDFSEFNKIVGGETGPLFGKAMARAKKFGTKDQFILTARPAESARPIQEFLASQGLNIPIENITGLANSTPEAKALWIADKVAEGYNDIYFADDALQNVQAVKNMLDQFDIKSKVQQAKYNFSKQMDFSFNKMLERKSGIAAEKIFSAAKARKRGEGKGRFRLFIPPSHEDFVGLMYNFLGKGEQGNKDRAFIEQALIKPLNRAYTELNKAKQATANDYRALIKQMPNARKMLTKKTSDGDFTYGDAIRVYLWDKAGYTVPGLSKTDQSRLVELIKGDSVLKPFADTIGLISRQKEGYVAPSQEWQVGDIRTDLAEATMGIGRQQFFGEFIENADIIFSPNNMNKIEAIYGRNFREALEDMLYRIKNGTNRPSGGNRLVNRFVDYINGSVGSTMFFNMRSATLQTMSAVNFLNFGDNNIMAASIAFANQPQFWSDFKMIFNSDMLRQRRAGVAFDINANELASAVSRSKQPARAAIKYLLNKGFTPTQIADSFAIAFGGASFYRNRVKTYLKQGLSQKEAQAKAFDDFQEIAEATQQSARPDMVSQQQASPLGKLILAFQNVTSQFNRLGKKAALDIINRRMSPPYKTQWQSDMSNMSRILYYLGVQNLIFYSLQTAMFALLFSDDEKDEEFFAKKQDRILNGTLDSILRGSGIGGAIVSTLKNAAIKIAENQGKKWGAEDNVAMKELLQLSPPLGIKARKLSSAEKSYQYNKKVIKHMSKFDIDNPMYDSVTNAAEAITNIPLARLYRKTQNVKEALNSDNEAWQRIALFMGWSKWDVGIENEEIKAVREEIKKNNKKIKEENKKTDVILQKPVEEIAVTKEEKKKEEQKEEKKEAPRCNATTSSGKPCKNKAVKNGKCWSHVEGDTDRDGDGIMEVQCTAFTKSGRRCRNKTENSNKRCYAHQ